MERSVECLWNDAAYSGRVSHLGSFESNGMALAHMARMFYLTDKLEKSFHWS